MSGEGADREPSLEANTLLSEDMVQSRTAERGDGTGGRAGGVV